MVETTDRLEKNWCVLSPCEAFCTYHFFFFWQIFTFDHEISQGCYLPFCGREPYLAFL